MSSDHASNEPLNDVAPIEPLSSLRRHPQWYFQTGRFERETVISLLVREASLSPQVTQASVLKDGPWTAVTANGDWLAGDLRAFSTPTPFPEGGVNATRVEILLTAFCDTVATAARGRRDDIELARAREIPDSMSAALADSGEGRVIVFRSPIVEHSPAAVTPLSNDIFSQPRIEKTMQRLEEYA